MTRIVQMSRVKSRIVDPFFEKIFMCDALTYNQVFDIIKLFSWAKGNQ